MNQWQSWLAEIGRQGDAAFDIAGAALEIAARDREGLEQDQESHSSSGIVIGRYRHHLEVLVADVAREARGALTAKDRARALREGLWRIRGYTGDKENYENIENADLMSVIDRRKGLPVALGIVYLHVARAQGWRAEGINFPSHFLIRLEGAGERVIIDPFNDGLTLDVSALRALVKQTVGAGSELDPRYYEPVSDREILIRLQNNIRMMAFKAGDIPRAVEVLCRLVLLEPELPEFWYELGMLEVHRERFAKGRHALEKCLSLLDRVPGSDDMRLRIVETLGEIISNMK
jgi:regulator of sirC expression with transglutaminase-like and TPR domain